MKGRRRRPNGDAAKRAITEAQRQQHAARARSADVEAVAMVADMLTRRSDRFVRELRDAMHRRA